MKMKRLKLAGSFMIGTYAISLISGFFLSNPINLLIPAAIVFIGMFFFGNKGIPVKEIPNILEPVLDSKIHGAQQGQVAIADEVAAPSAQTGTSGDPIWDPVHEYISVIEQMVMSEGEKNTLDNEIVEKTIALLARINRLIPQLKEINDGSINHNIQRLVFKDLNGAINPFLKLSGEAKVLNRRLLLNGLKDIDSKLSFYVETIESRDILELQTRMDLIQARYRTTDS
ncbi:hypothetical protein [Paenibacillus dendrobii]|nr:hypothetical protein [Paenibacillus dendrobii]